MPPKVEINSLLLSAPVGPTCLLAESAFLFFFTTVSFALDANVKGAGGSSGVQQVQEML